MTMVTFVEGFTSLYLLCMCNTGFLNKGRVAKKETTKFELNMANTGQQTLLNVRAVWITERK